MKIFLDYGHGGSDPGATYQGRREKDDNLEIGLAVAVELRKHGITVHESRTTDKTVSLKERTDMANRIKADYFLSIHRNAFKPETAQGVETFVFTSPSQGSLQLAEKVQAALVKVGFINRGVKRENFHVLRETAGPAVLTEIGFLDSTEDNRFFDAKKPEIAAALASAVLAQAGVSVPPAPDPVPEPVAGTPILGPAQATAEQAQAWAKNRGAHQRFIDIAPTYWSYGQRTGIRPEVLYAQSFKETNKGLFTGNVKPEQNNWAGIKIKNPIGDRTEDHETFATPDDGVRAHFNHIAAYVGFNPIGEPHDRYLVVKSLSWAGTVRTVEELGARWAPAANYGESIVKDYLVPLLATPKPEPAPGGEAVIQKEIAVYVNSEKTSEPAYLIGNATFVRAAYIVELVGGQVTGHGDHIKITLPKNQGETELLLAEIATLKRKIADAKKALE